MVLINRALAGIGLTSVYQPIVTLSSQQVVGYEALSRWPVFNHLSASAVFAHAHRVGAAVELDRKCIQSAITGAVHRGLPPDSVLFVNSEPVGRVDDEVFHGTDSLNIVVELTERRLFSDLEALVRRVAALRDRNIGIALDDVGTDPAVVPLLDMLRPSVVKLDLAYVHGCAFASRRRTLDAVRDYRERSGALIVAEGIETLAHYETALELGADLGQGYLFGRPCAA